MKNKPIYLIVFIILLLLNCLINLIFFDKGEILICAVHTEIIVILTFVFLYYYWKPKN